MTRAYKNITTMLLMIRKVMFDMTWTRISAPRNRVKRNRL